MVAGFTPQENTSPARRHRVGLLVVRDNGAGKDRFGIATKDPHFLRLCTTRFRSSRLISEPGSVFGGKLGCPFPCRKVFRKVSKGVTEVCISVGGRLCLFGVLSADRIWVGLMLMRQCGVWFVFLVLIGMDAYVMLQLAMMWFPCIPCIVYYAGLKFMVVF